ncbi:hypothetical protein [Granulicella sp. WH15]|uniref:hypothetical protein n=1 Tax=Granulicella sp. WH15 TaxID=2602070 RepID=UPI002103377A|nr:hypothetical protein [Granulicella sp. WH15]
MNLPHADHPMARISNGKLSAVIFLPDKDHGFYRASRFDWAGIVGCASLDGHTFFGEWFKKYDPMSNDAVAGPAEEFRHPTSELGYDEAAPGGLFVKIGVGVVRRIDDSPYRFGGAYPIVDNGRWKVKVHKRSIHFRQELHSPMGFAYIYEKVLSLDEHGNVLSLEHHLKNIGTKSIDTAVYDHDFFMLDNKTTGPDMKIHLPWTPVPDSALPSSAQITGTTIQFVSQLQPQHGVGSYLTGYSDKVSDYDILFEDRSTKLGVEQTSDSPINKFYLWATPKTVCPEAYIAIHVAPGKSQEWTIHYRFFTN